MSHNLKFISLEERIVLDAAAVAHVIYVNASAASHGDGSSWAHAYNNLQSALTTASSYSGATVIDIAQGTYTPSQVYSPLGSNHTPVTGGAYGQSVENLETFNLPNNTTLVGGFIVNGNSAVQSNNPSLTVLSGDLGGGINAWHVVTAGNDVLQTGVMATLDVLTVANGVAAGPDQGNVNAVLGVVFSLAYSHESGGGLYARFGSNINLNNDIFQNDSAALGTNPIPIIPGGGAIFAADPGTAITIANSQFLNDSTSGVSSQNAGGGGAIDMVMGVLVNVSNSTFSSDTSFRDGGAIRSGSGGGTLIVTNDLFTDDTAGGDLPVTGGAISMLNSNLTVNHSTFIDNSTSPLGGGGAIFFHTFEDTTPHTALIENSLFENNVGGSVFGGGAILGLGVITLPTSTMTITNDSFIDNTSVEGGAIHIDSLNSTISNSTFIDNSASVFGGAISESNLLGDLLLQSPLQMVVSNDYFSGNSVTFDPNQLATVQFVVTILPAPGAIDSAVGGGGAIANHENGQLIVKNSIFNDNSVTGGEGGAILNGGTIGHLATLSQLAFYQDNLSISTSLFSNNTTNQNGGAIASLAAPGTPIDPQLTLQTSLFTSNTAQNDGGALYMNSTNATIKLNAFISDQALLGDEIYASNSTINGGATSNPLTLASLELLNAIIPNETGDIVLL